VVQRLDPQVVAEALQEMVEGVSLRQLVAKYGISNGALRQHFAKAGLTRRRDARRGGPRFSDEVLAPAFEAMTGGESIRQAARVAGVGVSAVRNRLREQREAMAGERQRREGTLRLAERQEIRVGIEQGASDAEIARRIGRHRSTVWREIVANGGRAAYRAHEAERRSDQVARRPQPYWSETRPWLWEEVCRLLRKKKWSPGQIARRLRRDH
jgi:hypothetical protein